MALQRWYTSPSLSTTAAYPLIKNSRPRSNGRLYLFLHYQGLSQPEGHTSADYPLIQQHTQKNSQSLCIFFFDSASQKRLFCIVVNRSKKNPITPQRRHPDDKALDIEAPKVPQLRWPLEVRLCSYASRLDKGLWLQVTFCPSQNSVFPHAGQITVICKSTRMDWWRRPAVHLLLSEWNRKWPVLQ